MQVAIRISFWLIESEIHTTGRWFCVPYFIKGFSNFFSLFFLSLFVCYPRQAGSADKKFKTLTRTRQFVNEAGETVTVTTQRIVETSLASGRAMTIRKGMENLEQDWQVRCAHAEGGHDAQERRGKERHLQDFRILPSLHHHLISFLKNALPPPGGRWRSTRSW